MHQLNSIVKKSVILFLAIVATPVKIKSHYEAIMTTLVGRWEI